MPADFAAYCFYVNRPELLKRAVDSFAATWDELTIVDNSGYGIDTDLPDSVTIFEPPVPLSYAQSCNWMLKDAEKKHVDFILHFHSDATTTNPTAVHELLTYVRQMRDSGMDRWACAWTLYDVFWAVNPIAARDVGGWDTDFPNYHTDQVMKQRWKRRGWQLIDTHIEGMSHEGSAVTNSDPELKLRQQFMFPLIRMYYQSMYGGIPGEEKTLVPFDRPDIFK
jgi:hypothetical protein